MGIMSSKTGPWTEEQNAKRRRIASETSSQTITDVLPVEVLRDVFAFLGPGHYRYVAGTCRAFRDTYESAMPDQRSNETTYESAVASVPCAELCLREAGSILEIELAAARKGQIEVIEWAYSRGYKFDFYLFKEAARCGQLEVLEWADTKGLPWDFSNVADSAAMAGHVGILEWMLGHEAQLWSFRFCAYHAAGSGHVSVLEWLKEHGLDLGVSAPSQGVNACWRIAAENGHVPALDWLLDNSHSLQPIVISAAARQGHINVLQWARDHQVGWSYRTCALAAFHGQLNALMWLRNNGCPWDGNVIHWAQEKGHFEVLEWARDNGCPTEAERIYSLLEIFGGYWWCEIPPLPPRFERFSFMSPPRHFPPPLEGTRTFIFVETQAGRS